MIHPADLPHLLGQTGGVCASATGTYPAADVIVAAPSTWVPA
jgi:hypothetical protein